MQKVLVGVVVVFALFYLMTQPAAAADVVRGAADTVGNVFESVITFLDALLS